MKRWRDKYLTSRIVEKEWKDAPVRSHAFQTIESQVDGEKKTTSVELSKQISSVRNSVFFIACEMLGLSIWIRWVNKFNLPVHAACWVLVKNGVGVSIDGQLPALKPGGNKRCDCLEARIDVPHRNKQSTSLWGWLPTVNGLGSYSYWDGYKPNGGNECLGKNPLVFGREKKQTANLRLQGWAGWNTWATV